MSTNTTLPPLPTAGKMANWEWVKAEWSRLLRDYPDQWIAVDQGRVLAAGQDLGEVAEAARSASASADVVYEFIAGASLIF